MALDTATNRGSLIYGFLPVPSGTVDQPARQTLVPMLFATPISVIPEVWTLQDDVSSSWATVSNASSVWSVQADESTTWS